MSKTKLTIKEVEKKARKSNSTEYVTLQNYEGKDKQELTLDVTYYDNSFSYFLNTSGSKGGRRIISRQESQDLLQKHNVYSS